MFITFSSTPVRDLDVDVDFAVNAIVQEAPVTEQMIIDRVNWKMYEIVSDEYNCLRP